MVCVNRKMFVVLVAALLMLGMLNTALPVSAAPSVIHVYPGESIQASVDAAKAGDKIIVHAGTYHEQVTVDKTLTLQGLDAVIDLTGFSFSEGINAAILVEASRVTVSGFTIKNVPHGPEWPPVQFPGSFAISLVGSMGNSLSGGLIENNKITTDYFGIGVNGVPNVEVRNNRVTAVWPIPVWNAPNVVIRNNFLSAKANPLYPDYPVSGIWMGGDFSGGLVENNIISSVLFGISLNGQSNIEIRNNVVYTAATAIWTSVTGIWLIDASNVIIRGNVVSAKASANNPGPVNGIFFMEGCTGASVENNIISSDYFGICFSRSSNINLRNNIIYSSGHAIDGAVTLGVTISNNAIHASQGITISGPPDAIAPNIIIEGNIVHCEQKGISVQRTENSIIQNNKLYSTTAQSFVIELSGINNNIAFNKVSGIFANGIAIEPVTGEGPMNFDSTGNTVAKNTIIGAGVMGDGDIGIHLFPGTSANIVIHNNISGVDFPIVNEGT